MIEVTRLGGKTLLINAELIETVEAVPDTVITLTTGRKLVVSESPEEVVQRCLAYRRRLAQNKRASRWEPVVGGES